MDIADMGKLGIFVDGDNKWRCWVKLGLGLG